MGFTVVFVVVLGCFGVLEMGGRRFGAFGFETRSSELGFSILDVYDFGLGIGMVVKIRVPFRGLHIEASQNYGRDVNGYLFWFLGSRVEFRI